MYICIYIYMYVYDVESCKAGRLGICEDYAFTLTRLQPHMWQQECQTSHEQAVGKGKDYGQSIRVPFRIL